MAKRMSILVGALILLVPLTVTWAATSFTPLGRQQVVRRHSIQASARTQLGFVTRIGTSSMMKLRRDITRARSWILSPTLTFASILAKSKKRSLGLDTSST